MTKFSKRSTATATTPTTTPATTPATPSQLLTDIQTCVTTYQQTPTSNVADITKIEGLISCVAKAVTSDHVAQTITNLPFGL